MLISGSKNKVKKLGARSKEAIMVGYSTQSKGYRIWDTRLAKLMVSRDVTFDESSVSSHATQINTDHKQPGNIVVPGGDTKQEVDDNFDLVPKNPEQTESIGSTNSDHEFDDAQDNLASASRRSQRVLKQPGEW